MPEQLPVKHKAPFVPPVFLVNTALRLRRFLLKLADSVVPSYLPVMDRFMGAATTQLVAAAARMRLADLLVDGPLPASELAKRTESDPDALERMLRALVSVGVFELLPDGRFANNRLSKALVTGTPANIRGFAQFFGMEPMVRAWQHLPRTLAGERVGFTQVNGRHVWEWMDEDHVMRSAFVEGMSSMTEVIAPAIAQRYPWREVKTVCDVGGGVGIVLAAALNHHPHLEGMLFDSAGMLGEAQAHLEKHGIVDRVKLVPGSFFESIPRGADAYVLKTVVHNWDDPDALRILKNVRAAMDPGNRLVVADFLNAHDPVTTLVPFMDMAGMMMFSGRERTPEAMGRLFEQAGFRLRRVIELPGRQAIFEGVAVG